MGAKAGAFGASTEADIGWGAGVAPVVPKLNFKAGVLDAPKDASDFAGVPSDADMGLVKAANG